MSGLDLRSVEAELRGSIDVGLRASLDHRPHRHPKYLATSLAREGPGGEISSAPYGSNPGAGFAGGTRAVGNPSDPTRGVGACVGGWPGPDGGKKCRFGGDHAASEGGEPGGVASTLEVTSGAGFRVGSGPTQGRWRGEGAMVSPLLRREGLADDGKRAALPEAATADGLQELRREIRQLEGKILAKLGPGDGGRSVDDHGGGVEEQEMTRAPGVPPGEMLADTARPPPITSSVYREQCSSPG